MEQQSTSEHAHAQASDMEIEAAMLAEAAALVDDASSAAGDASAMPAETPADGAGAAIGDDDDSDVGDAGSVDGDGDTEDYDSAVDDTDEDGDTAEGDATLVVTLGDDEADVVPAPAVDDAALLAAMAPDSAPLTPAPPSPGSPESPFRKCDCLGTMPGRACLRCGGSRWTKQCTHTGCGGRGTLSTPSRHAAGPPRVERCGFCMGRGLVPARGAEIAEAQNLHMDAVAAETRRKAQQAFAAPTRTAADAANIAYNRVIQRRKPVLPSANKPKQKTKSKPGAKRK